MDNLDQDTNDKRLNALVQYYVAHTSKEYLKEPIFLEEDRLPITRDAVATMGHIVLNFIEYLAKDLEALCNHRKRKVINVEDVMFYCRHNPSLAESLQIHLATLRKNNRKAKKSNPSGKGFKVKTSVKNVGQTDVPPMNNSPMKNPPMNNSPMKNPPMDNLPKIDTEDSFILILDDEE